MNLLFEIDEEYIGKLINNLSENMQNNQSILTIPMYLITKTMDTFISYTPKDFVLSWNNIEFQGITLIEQGSLNLNKLVEQNEVFKRIYDIMIIVETFGMIILLADWLRNLFLDLLGIDWTGLKADQNEMTITNTIDMDTGENYTTYTGEDIDGNRYKIKYNHTKEKQHRKIGFGR